MKVKLVERETEEKFEPFSIEITLESLSEAERLWGLLNGNAVDEWLGVTETHELWVAVNRALREYDFENRTEECELTLRKYFKNIRGF